MTRQNTPSRNPSELARFLVLVFCFLLSGLAALIYQTVWTRQFSLVFGTSELAVATVLAAYMGGLALGARLIERWLPRIRRPVLVYAGVELGIGASALLLVPALLRASDELLQLLFGNQPAPPGSEQVGMSVYYLVSALAALALPAMLMGATLPLLARHTIHAEAQIGRRIGVLYAVNTCGAVAGALAAAFWLLPALGLTRATWAAAAVNVAVFLLAALLVRRSRRDPDPEASVMPGAAGAFPALPARPRFPAVRPPAPFWVLPIMLASGAVSFFHEVLWTRMLSHVLGSSIYAFGVMVASFLAGIALGGALGGVLARGRQSAACGLALSQLGCAVSAAISYTLLDITLPERTGLGGNAFLAAALLMPMTTFIGMTYPFAVRVLSGRAEDAPAASARVYSWNTVGAIAGALAAGFVLIPWLRFEGSIQLAVAMSALLCVVSVWLPHGQPRPLGASATALAIACVILFRAEEPRRLLLASSLNMPDDGRILYYDVGRSASVVVLEQNEGLVLRTNGLPEALMDRSGAAPRFSGEFWLSPLAVIARPQTQSLLVVGYGGGVVIEGVPPSVKHIDVIEIEPQVIEANRAIRTLRKYDPLADPRLRVIHNDARGALRLTNRRYDAIVSQPSHPWTAGSSHLYTREFMRLARSHLSDGGVFVQWMNISFLDEALLRSLTATLLDVFGEVRIYRPDPSTLVFLASTRPLEIERRVTESGVPLVRSPAHYGRFGINTAEDLVVALAVDGEGARRLAGDAPLITDDTNAMALANVYEHGRALTPESIGRILAPYDPLQQPDGWLFRELGDRLSFDYVARRLALFAPLDGSVPDRLAGLVQALGATQAGYAVRAVELTVRGEREAAQKLLRDAVITFPSSQRLRYEYVKPWIHRIGRDAAPPEVATEASKLTGTAAAMIRAAQLAAHGQWQEVAKLDAVLATASWTDPWKFDAVQARAQWRIRSGNEDSRSRLAGKALAIIDRSIVVQPTLALYGMRLHCALAAGRYEALLESIRIYGRGTFVEAMRHPPDERRAAIETLQALLKLLDTELTADRASPGRVRDVRSRLQEDLEQLGQAS